MVSVQSMQWSIEVGGADKERASTTVHCIKRKKAIDLSKLIFADH